MKVMGYVAGVVGVAEQTSALLSNRRRGALPGLANAV
jgi:hypothetical protein